jgi:signal transduction histidine kinase
MVAELQPDIVLLDVHLPDINGLEVCRRLKGSKETAGTIVIQISASAISAPQATASLNSGADTYVIEPVDPDVLVATVRAFLRLRETEQALAKANLQLSEKNEELLVVNQALQRSNEDLEQFAAIASHDLQEPLRTIITHLQLLEVIANERFTDDERPLLASVVDGARRMSLLIHDVLAYSRVGTEQPLRHPVKLDDALGWALGNLAESLSVCGGKVDADPLPTVAGDVSQLGQVFQNLIGNSIKYSSPLTPPVIRITSRVEGSGFHLIALSDNGIGIAPAYFDNVFRPFKRLHGHEIPGTGIGLALCRRVIEGHGGRIWVDSAEGRGATFFFTLPAARNLG